MPSDNHSDRAQDRALDGPSEDVSFEDGLAEAIHRTGDTFAPQDRAVLVNNSLTRGRRLLARRRTAAVTGSVLALAAVGIGGGYGAGLLGPDQRPGEVGKAGKAESAQWAAEPPGTITGPTTAGGGSMTAILARLLPAGKLSETRERQIGQIGGPSVVGVFDDGKGKAGISVSLSRANGLNSAQQAKCPDRVFTPYDDCTVTELADGARLVIFQGYEYPDRREDTKNWRAELLTSDGFLINANEYNAPSQKGAKISRADPPLNPGQLKALVTSDKWRGTLNRLPPAPPTGKEPADGTTGGVDGTVNEIDAGKTLISLLPRGLKVTGQGGQGVGYAYVVVDDGKGRSMVEINVQPGSSDLAKDLFKEATTLPDGTLLETRQGSGDKGVPGGAMWTADTLRPNGLRVVISALNAGDPHSAPSRSTPALTMKQLTAIATSKKWRATP
ncbi:hypothetical protein [Streptomyces sp. NPDC059479]|uniref:hypothetical protein n=1 Tax=Streptomyces sp. NPDC059479 TaxID=3346848 RepID=UPI0036A7FB45